MGLEVKQQLDKIAEDIKDSTVLPENFNTQINSVSDKWNELLQFTQQNKCDWLKAWGAAYAKNPYVQNDRLKAIKTVGIRYSRDKIEQMLNSPQTNEQGLRASSRYFYNTIPPVMKLYNMYADILTYRTYIKLNSLSSNVGNKVKREYAQIANWLRSFDVKRTFRNETLKIMLEGKKFYFYRSDEINKIYTLHELPSDYCKIVHRYEGGWQFAFNMMYFLKPGVMIQDFPPEFQEYLAEFYDYYDVNENQLNPTGNMPDDVLAYYTNRNWFFWKYLPVDQTFCYSFDDTIPEVVPPLASMFLDANDLNTYKLLEQELLSIPLKQIMTATVPMTKENKSGSYSNDTAVTPDLIQLYQDIIQSILPQSTTFIAAPFENFNVHTFENVSTKNSIVGDAMQNWYSQGGVSGLLTTSSKPNLAQVKISQVLESRFIDKVYSQIRYFLNQRVKEMNLKNDFEVFVEGDVFSDRDKYEAITKALSQGQKDVLPEYLSFYGSYLDTAEGTMQLVDAFDYYNKLQPLVSSFQQKGIDTGDNANGRPSANENNIENDNTANSINAGTNKSSGRVVKFSLDNMNEEQQQELLDLIKDYGLDSEINEEE